jgi:hypothetical protein
VCKSVIFSHHTVLISVNILELLVITYSGEKYVKGNAWPNCSTIFLLVKVIFSKKKVIDSSNKMKYCNKMFSTYIS